jgi:hypothetical protein
MRIVTLATCIVAFAIKNIAVGPISMGARGLNAF